MKPHLAVVGLNKRFSLEDDQVVALSDVSVDLKKGEVLMVVGPSGCGKSTLLNIIAGLESADSGTVTIDGKPVTGPGADRTVIFQDGGLFPWLTVQQNVEFGLRQLGVSAKERAEKSRAFLARLGLAGFEDRSIHELSGGMRQRVSIARAMVLDPKVMLIDEPFSALDAMTREDLYALLQELWTASTTTVVFVTHNMREAATLGDKVALMSPRPGRIVGVYPVDIPRPRKIDDAGVSHLAQELASRLKAGSA